MTSTVESSLAAATTTRSPRSSGTMWLLRRSVVSLLLLLVVSLLVFGATQGLPGDVAERVAGRGATAEQLQAVRDRLELGQSKPAQYLGWLSGLVTGDPGVSLSAQVPVWTMVSSAVRNSYLLVVVSMTITFPLSVILGVWSAYRRDRAGDRALLGVSIGVNALPEFVVGTLLVFTFATTIFQVLPAVSLLPPGDNPLGHIPEMVLPVVTLSLLGVTYLYRLIRASVIDVLDSEYIQMALMKGLSTRRVLFRHALPNAVVPTIQATAVVAAYCLGGVVVIEYVFGYPGIGTALTKAVGVRDLPVVQFLVMIIAATFIVLNLLADVLAVYLSPRTRSGGR